MQSETDLSADILRGAERIAGYLGTNKRRVYHLAAAGALPTFQEGSMICMRKSTYLRAIEAQEQVAHE